MNTEQLSQMYSPEILLALRSLNALIEAGAEFPDAVYRVHLKTGFTVDALTAVYDMQD